MNLPEWTNLLFHSNMEELLKQIPQKDDLSLLHFQCGTGQATQALCAYAQDVVGADTSRENIRKAAESFPHIPFQAISLEKPTFENRFDVVFAYDVFQDFPDQHALLQFMFRALKPGGCLICEMGAPGNLNKIETGLKSMLECYGHLYQSPFYYTPWTDYQTLLTDHHFRVQQLEEYPLSVALPEGRDALQAYISQRFGLSQFALPPQVESELFVHIENVFLTDCWKNGHWELDFRHLRMIAYKD